jgi:hypothetical protein
MLIPYFVRCLLYIYKKNKRTANKREVDLYQYKWGKESEVNEWECSQSELQLRPNKPFGGHMNLELL